MENLATQSELVGHLAFLRGMTGRIIKRQPQATGSGSSVMKGGPAIARADAVRAIAATSAAIPKTKSCDITFHRFIRNDGRYG